MYIPSRLPRAILNSGQSLLSSIPQTPLHTTCRCSMAPWSAAQRHRRRSWRWTTDRWSCSPGRCGRWRCRGETVPQCAADSRNSTRPGTGTDAQGGSPGIENWAGWEGREVIRSNLMTVLVKSQFMNLHELTGANKHISWANYSCNLSCTCTTSC